MRIVQHHKKIFNKNDMTAINNRNTSSVRTMRRNVLTLGTIILITLAANVPRCVTASYILYSGLHVRTIISLKISNHFLLLNPVLDPIIHVLRIREYRDRVKSVCRCYNQQNNSTEVITLTHAIHIWFSITVVKYHRYFVPRESELRLLNKPNNTGVITLKAHRLSELNFLFILKVANIRCFTLIHCSEQKARFRKSVIMS